jgi:hypothetical protein
MISSIRSSISSASEMSIAGEQVVELFHGARAEECAGHARVSDRERHPEVRHGQTRHSGEWAELFNAVERRSSLSALEEASAAEVVLLALADAAGEQPLPQRSRHQHAHPLALCDRQHVGLDAAVEDRVGRLLGAEPFHGIPCESA